MPPVALRGGARGDPFPPFSRATRNGPQRFVRRDENFRSRGRFSAAISIAVSRRCATYGTAGDRAWTPLGHPDHDDMHPRRGTRSGLTDEAREARATRGLEA